MISLRHHLLTLVAVFLALATGIVLGGGPLSNVGAKVTENRGETSPAASPDDQSESVYTDAFVAAVAPSVVAGTLEGGQVALVTIPGVDQQVVEDVIDQVTVAGGEVSARVALTAAMVDPAQKSLVDTLGSQLMTQQSKKEVSSDATTYDRMGELLGLAIASKDPEETEMTGRSRSVIEAISGATLMDEPEDITLRAPLVLVVVGEDTPDDESDAILAGLTTGLAAQATGVVLAGTVGDGRDGQLSRFRASAAAANIASVDGIDTQAGRIATILTLERSLTTQGGAFGASGADGPLPLG